MDKVLQSFEGLIRRSIAPSMTLFVFAAALYLVLVELSGGSAVDRSMTYLRLLGETLAKSSGAFTVIAVLLVLGTSYGLATLQQILFDNRVKQDFDPWPRSAWLRKSAASEARALTELRGRVLKRLRTEPALAGLHDLEEGTDFVLYEILGGIDPNPTHAFVDSAKATGITCVSMILVLLGGVLAFGESLAWGWQALLFLLLIFSYWLGREATLAQYRHRAIRLYVNFLLMPKERIQHRLWPERER